MWAAPSPSFANWCRRIRQTRNWYSNLKWLHILFGRYIRLLSNVLEWQKGQDRNGMQHHDVRIKCESHLNNQNPIAYHAKPAIAFLKQEKQNMSENSHVFRINYSAQRHNACDKNGSNLLMIAPNGLNVTIPTGKRCVTPSVIVTQGNFHSNNNGNLIRSPSSGRSSNFPKSPQISSNTSVISNGSSSSLTSHTPVTNGIGSSGSNCAQKRFKIERDEEEQAPRDCRVPPPPAHSIPVRKRVKVAFVKDSSSGYRGDLCGADRKWSIEERWQEDGEGWERRVFLKEYFIMYFALHRLY